MPITRVHLKLSSLLLRVRASDPGSMRLISSLRGLAAGLLTAGALYPVKLAVHASFLTFFPGIYLAVLDGVFTNDATLKGQRVTILFTLLAALVVFPIAALITPSIGLSAAGFIIVIFTATYIRKFGPRWTTVGTCCFFLEFVATFSHPKLADLPLSALSLFVGAAFTYTVRFWLLPSRPAQDLHRMIDSFAAELKLFARTNDERPTSDHAPDALIEGLNESGLSLDENFAKIKAGDDAALVTRARELVLFSESRAEDGEARRSALNEEQIRDVTSDLHSLIERLTTAGRDLGVPKQGQPPFQNPERSFRLACQAALAGLLAIAVGRGLSEAHWYWVLLSSYVVFIRTKTFADTTARAWQRVVGTLIGSGFALIIVNEFQANGFSLVILCIAIFVAYYFIQTAYLLMAVFITIFFSEVYKLTGQFSFQVLAARVGLTFLGALISVIVARFISPLRPSEEISESRRSAKAALDHLRAKWLDRGDRLAPPSLQEKQILFNDIRELDRALRTLRSLHPAKEDLSKVTSLLKDAAAERRRAGELMGFPSPST